MTLPAYTKPYRTPAQRVAHLRSRGLTVRRPALATQRIEQIGYERLRIYFISRRQSGLPGRPFIPGTTYDDIIRLHDCDHLIRKICFEAVARFELLFRNTLSEVLSQQHGSHPWSVPGIFRDASSERQAYQTLLGVVAQTKDPRIAHYIATYGQPMLPPVWTIKEVLTFGAAARLYKTLAGPLRGAIASAFGVSKEPVFQSWLECLVDLRNICAHHDRLFNRHFQKQPQSLRAAGVPTAPKNSLKALLQCLDYLLAHRGLTAALTTNVGRMVGQCAQMQPSEAGY